MENNNLNKKIIENVRNRVVISNLESGETMKISKRKHIVSIIAVAIIMLTGSFVTVNATTNGELANKVKETIKVIFVKDNGEEEKIEAKTYTDSNNHTIEKYETTNNGIDYVLEVDKTNINKTNININETIKNDEARIIYNK